MLKTFKELPTKSKTKIWKSAKEVRCPVKGCGAEVKSARPDGESLRVTFKCDHAAKVWHKFLVV